MLTKELAAAEAGGPIDDWCERIAVLPMLRFDLYNVNMPSDDQRLMTTLQLALHRAAAES